MHRTADNGLMFRTGDPGAGGDVLLMSEEQAWHLIRGADRVMSCAAASADGTFTPMPPGQHIREHLTIYRYQVSSPTIQVHTALVAATAWASWVAPLPGSALPGITWQVDVFAGDNDQFLQAALAAGVTVLDLTEAALGSQDG
jgi:hypothetical protein